MKKNPRNEIRGIVFLLVACLIWGIYVLNAEAATGCTLTVYDSQGNEVTNGSTARVCSNFSAKLTVPLSAFSGATNDTNNDFKADLNVSDGTSTYVHNLSGSIVGETVVFEIRGISCTTAGEAVFSVEVSRLTCNGTSVVVPDAPATTSIEIVKCEREVTGFSVTGYRAGSGDSLIVDPGTCRFGNYDGLYYPPDGAIPEISYKLQEEKDDAYITYITPESPLVAGSYVARLSYDETNYYKPFSTTTTFTILPAYGYALSIQVADVKAGETPSPVVTDGENNLENNSEVNYVVEYKASDAADTAYSTTAPTAGGTYVARVSLYNSSGSLLKTATTTFKIGKQSGNGTITVENIRYGSGTVKPVVASETNGTGNVRVEYKLTEASDSTYSTTVPTIPGKYSARAIFAPTDQYEEVVAVTKFEIYKAYGTATVSAKDIYYGMAVDVKAVTAASNAGTAVLEYKQTGAADSTYSTTVPTEIGSYTVRATYPESACYFSFYATGKFEITYMPTPEFVLNGTTGKNDYFTSDIVVTTQPGYLVAGSLDGEYASSLSLSDGNMVSYLYFMEEATGAKSAGVSTAGIKIDTIFPQFSNLPTTNILYSDTWTTTISDLHLASVMLNGEKQDVNGNSLRLELEAEGGQRELELVATDDAGNTEKLVFTLAATWLEEKEIPIGQTISLEAGTAYQLGEGTWQIGSDSTAYAGGATVYIREEGQYVFSNY